MLNNYLDFNQSVCVCVYAHSAHTLLFSTDRQGVLRYTTLATRARRLQTSFMLVLPSNRLLPTLTTTDPHLLLLPIHLSSQTIYFSAAKQAAAIDTGSFTDYCPAMRGEGENEYLSEMYTSPAPTDSKGEKVCIRALLIRQVSAAQVGSVLFAYVLLCFLFLLLLYFVLLSFYLTAT